MTTALTPARRALLARRVRLFVATTISYNVIEAVVAIAEGTRVVLEHSGFDLTAAFGAQAFAGAARGWSRMLGNLPAAAAKV